MLAFRGVHRRTSTNHYTENRYKGDCRKTLIGKAAYLLEKGLAKPDEILLISFARKVKKELDKRVQRLWHDSSELTIKTFHSLGLKIIGSVEGKVPSVSKLSTDRFKLRKTIQEYIDKRKENQDFLMP